MPKYIIKFISIEMIKNISRKTTNIINVIFIEVMQILVSRKSFNNSLFIKKKVVENKKKRY